MSKERFKQSITQLNIRHIWALITLTAVTFALTFHFNDGYFELGEEKYLIYMRITRWMIPVWVVLVIAYLIMHCQKPDIPGMIRNISVTGWFMILLVLAGAISTLTSDFREVSLWGHDGWHMGFIVQLMMIICCLMAADLFANGRKGMQMVMLAAGLSISTAALVLGIINRFSIYPFRMWGQAEDFISTLGNIDWFCGYWCVWMGVGCGLFLCAGNSIARFVSGVYVWICGVAGVCCGASSCYLAWGAVSFAALLWALKDSDRLMKLCDMEILMLAALPTVRLMGALRPHRMWYDSAWLKEVSYGDAWMKPFIIGVVLFSVLKEVYRSRKRDRSGIRSLLTGISCGGFIAVVLLIILNSSIDGGLWPVRGMNIFTWGVNWGNGRGGIWLVSAELIRRMMPFRLFFGVGCDCMCSYAYSMEDIVTTLNRYLGRVYLTNAHNELLSMLINEGITGAVAYFGIQISHIARCAKVLDHPEEGEPGTYTGDHVYDGLLLGSVLSVAGYIGIGLVGFMQILSTPFLFMIIGMAMGLINRKNNNRM